MFLGDSLIALEALRAIRARHPSTTLIVNPDFAELFRDFETIEYAAPWLRYGEGISLGAIPHFIRFFCASSQRSSGTLRST